MMLAMNSLAVCLAVLFVGAVFGYAQDADTNTGTSSETITCGVGVEWQTVPVRSGAGFTVVVTVSADDDHSKNSHQCAADYTLKITRPDGSSVPPYKFLSSDDEWGRPLRFRVEGFSKDGRHVFILLMEGNYPQSLQADEFDVNSAHKLKSVLLDRPFTRGLSQDCAATLHIIGTFQEAYIVLGTEAKDGCGSVERWQLAHNKHVLQGNLPAEVPINHPVHLPRQAAVIELEPGTSAEPR